jgi:hypothetical protein
MNRLFAEFFAMTVGLIHVFFLLGLALALLGLFLDFSASLAPLDISARGLPGPVVLAVAFVGYVLIMGVVSTLIAINQNLERLAQDADRRGGYEVNSDEPMTARLSCLRIPVRKVFRAALHTRVVERLEARCWDVDIATER